jgi:hypothetical protein
LQEVADLARFDFELVRILDVLVGAPTAASEIWTRRLNAVRRRLVDIDNFSFGQLFFVPGDFCRDELAVDGEWNEHGLSMFPSNSFTAEGDVFDL